MSTTRRDVAQSPWSIAWRRLRRRPGALWGAGIAGALLLAGVAAPLLARLEGQDPYTYHIDLLDPARGNIPHGPFGGVSRAHWFGVEPLTGRDLFAITVYGARTSLLIGLSATVLAVSVGTIVGLTSAYLGGWTDMVLSRVTDVMFGFPTLIFMIALGAIVPPDFPRPVLLVLIIGLFGWPYFARLVRGFGLSLVQRDFVEAARMLGARPWRVIGHELLPNVTGPIIALGTLTIPGNIATEAALSFLGVGVSPPTPDWGRSINDSVDWIQSDAMYLIFPAGMLLLTVLALTVLGDGLRDALDTRTVRLTSR
ncbi:MAG TPA: ABC transporter permease [Jatrophihabitantaceae bacterium]|nr:ABC transporter permease [Jatrophihabitantaceae bacterium]